MGAIDRGACRHGILFLDIEGPKTIGGKRSMKDVIILISFMHQYILTVVEEIRMITSLLR